MNSTTDRPPSALGRPSRTGASLIELMTVLTVLAIALGTMIPSLQTRQADTVSAAADVLAADLRHAAELAVRDGESFQVVLSEARDGWQILPVNAVGNPEGVQPSVKLPDLLRRPFLITGRLQTSASDITALRFNSFGEPETTAGGPLSENAVLWVSVNDGPVIYSLPVVIDRATGAVTGGPPQTGMPPAASS